MIRLYYLINASFIQTNWKACNKINSYKILRFSFAQQCILIGSSEIHKMMEHEMTESKRFILLKNCKFHVLRLLYFSAKR